jgi:hypothetical protein
VAQAPPGSSLSLYCATSERWPTSSLASFLGRCVINAVGESSSKVSAVERRLGGPLSCHGDIPRPTDRYGRQHATCIMTGGMYRYARLWNPKGSCKAPNGGFDSARRLRSGCCCP